MQIIVNNGVVLDVPEEKEHKYTDGYLETATIVHTGSDESDESKTINEYINYWLDNAIRESYRAISPEIARHLKEEPNKELFYEYIYQMYVAPMLVYIARHEDNKAGSSVQQSMNAMDLFYNHTPQQERKTRA